MISEYSHCYFTSARVSQSLRNDRCQNILYKAVFEHFVELKKIAALLLTSKAFQNSSFGANFILNYIVDKQSIGLLDAILSPSSCFSLQFVPSLHVKYSEYDSESVGQKILNFSAEIANSKYLPLQLQCLTLEGVPKRVVLSFFCRSIVPFPHLNNLNLEGSAVDDSVMSLISRSGASHLRSLSLKATSGVSAAGLQNISALERITFLNLHYASGITNDSLEQVAKMGNLQELNLSMCREFDDTGLRHLSTLSRISSLNLAQCEQITDRGLEYIRHLSVLANLNLTNCRRVSDVGIQHVSSLALIKRLNLCECDCVTDAGLKLLHSLEDIEWINLADCSKITDAAREKFVELLPNCHVNV